MKMPRILKFVLVGLFFAMVCEIQYNLIARENLRGFAVTLVFYPCYLVFVYFSSKIIDRTLPYRVAADIVYFLVYGLLGLIIEWTWLGNSPTVNPNASQITMVSFWESFAFMPRIFTDERPGFKRIRLSIMSFFFVYVLIALGGSLFFEQPIQFMWIIYASMVGYNCLNVFYAWYFVKSARIEPNPS